MDDELWSTPEDSSKHALILKVANFIEYVMVQTVGIVCGERSVDNAVPQILQVILDRRHSPNLRSKECGRQENEQERYIEQHTIIN